jgi:hypothetical protein
MLTKTQHGLVGFLATVIGLVIAALVNASFLASVGMVVLIYVVLGFGYIAVARTRNSN